MENKEENTLDNFTRNLFKTTSLEKPGFDFTVKVMAQLPKPTVANKVFQYQPLISRKGWIISATTFVLSFVLLLRVIDPASLNLVSFSNLELGKNWFNWFSKSFSIINDVAVMISVCIFTLYFMLEVFILSARNKNSRV